jgi:hypothetical protein
MVVLLRAHPDLACRCAGQHLPALSRMIARTVNRPALSTLYSIQINQIKNF